MTYVGKVGELVIPRISCSFHRYLILQLKEHFDYDISRHNGWESLL
jgi:hypothetical protein